MYYINCIGEFPTGILWKTAPKDMFVFVAGGVVPLVDIGLVLDRDYTVDMVVRADTHHSVSRMPSETVQAVYQGKQKSEQEYHVNYSHLLADIDCADVLLREDFIPMVIAV